MHPASANMSMKQQLQYFCITLLITLLPFIISGPIIITDAQSTDLGCLSQVCGSITNISYPFGLASRPECPVFNQFFTLTCDESTHELFLFQDLTVQNVSYTPAQVVSIQSDSLILNLTKRSKNELFYLNKNSQCQRYDDNNLALDWKLPPEGVGPYVISDENVFGSFGSTMGTLFVTNVVENNNNSGVSISGVQAIACSVQLPGDANNTQCGNLSCCISEMPKVGSNMNGKPFSPRYYYNSVSSSPFVDFSSNTTPTAPNCDGNFSALFHPNYTDFQSNFGVKVNWAIPLPTDFPLNNTNATQISEAIKNRPDYVCVSNDTGGLNFTILPEIPGYRCFCLPGYIGDGYANGTGCLDVNECDFTNDCISGKATCQNFNGSYDCKCKSIFHDGDGKRNGSGCKISQRTIHAISISCGVVWCGVMICIIIFTIKWWKNKTRRYHFLQNGGMQLQEFMRSRGRETLRLFSEAELSNATNNYSDNNIVGVGGFGAVFRGVLEDGRNIAIKKAKHGDGDNNQFLNEMDILTQINHRHIVKVLGCCLETPTPLLVYEYICNGSLADNMHRKGDGTIMTWRERLTIAKQTSEALAYLHVEISPPVFHRDVKPGNILLDDKWNAKVADFGVSRLLLDGNEHVSTIVQGTLGYLDPEYFHTLQLTDKSDVYSFGVVLVELITCLKPVDNKNRSAEFCNLATLFMHHLKMETLEEIIDPNLEVCDLLMDHSNGYGFKVKSSIMLVASLAYSCLSLHGNERPTMRDVAIKLQQIFQTFIYGMEVTSEDTIPLLPPKVKMEKYNDIENMIGLHEQSETESYSMSINALNAPAMPR